MRSLLLWGGYFKELPYEKIHRLSNLYNLLHFRTCLAVFNPSAAERTIFRTNPGGKKTTEFTALKDIELTIRPEKITVFKGPSGSGKTTLLSIVGCMARPTAGRIMVNGQETTSLPEKFLAEIRRNTFGFVFQNYNLIKGITVLENTMLPAYPLGQRRRELRAKAMELLNKFKIDAKAAVKNRGQPLPGR
jgi:ABC-type lipoprotein export system ATPase subunit